MAKYTQPAETTMLSYLAIHRTASVYDEWSIIIMIADKKLFANQTLLIKKLFFVGKNKIPQ